MLKKKNILNYLLAVYIFLPVFVFAQRVNDLMGLIDLVKGLFKAILPLMMTLAVIYFVWSLVLYMKEAGEKQAEAREQMIWGIVILFVMVSVWGLVNILDKTLFG